MNWVFVILFGKHVKPDEQSFFSSEPRQHHHHERITSRVKREVVLRLLKGESIETVSQELGVTVRRIEQWRDRFVEAGSAELARRESDSQRSWAAKHSRSIWQWTWLLIALVAVISVLVVLMQRSPQE